MTPRFQAFIDFILSHETEFEKGHYGDWNHVRTEHDPDDLGGTTRFGVDQRSHPGVDVDHLTKEQATWIYWQEWRAAAVDVMPAKVGECYYNAVVNCGAGRAKKLLVEAGDNASRFLTAQSEFYKRLVAARPSFQKYIKGWLQRVNDLRQQLDL